MSSRPMCKKLAVLSHARTLETINGLSIKQIEQRAAPLEDRTKDEAEWQCRSHTGFLGPGESFIGVLERDWCVVREMGLTHLALAGLLRDFLCHAEPRIKHQGKLEYLPPLEMEGESLKVVEHPMTFSVRREFFMSPQYSLFHNKEGSEADLNQSWAVEYHIKNCSNGMELVVGGDSAGGVLHYIENFGFYEGGEPHNMYRIPPEVLLAALTGPCSPLSLSTLGDRFAAQQAQISQEIDADTARLKHLGASSPHTEEVGWLLHRVAKLEDRLVAVRRTHKKALAKAKSFLQ